MVGQLWPHFLAREGPIGDTHAEGRLIALITQVPVVLYGMLPHAAVRSSIGAAARRVPAMVGFWLSVDPLDYRGRAVPDLGFTSVLFRPEGVFAARSADEKARLQQVALQRRNGLHTDLPECCVIFEAARTLPARHAEYDVQAFRYFPADEETQLPDIVGGASLDGFEDWERRVVHRLSRLASI